ncbi:hypothetical protein [Marinobacter sp.]|jgi:hypothetical protein|uniref:hypothetical protein n=1 Tax=Marinobacter sp. TaxID=50741 RepID=UPI002355A255|nr:hypothetical protein [Marinobacter sp.]|tara:strand:- start:189 stop:494 length:306 start_codon:yes stop_codon:yes gene_type:complete
MSKFASGKYALGISDRSGFAYPLNRMRKEWTGALVGFDEWEAKSPQIEPFPKVDDPQALKDPRPDRSEAMVVHVAARDPVIEDFIPTKASGNVGSVTVTTS